MPPRRSQRPQRAPAGRPRIDATRGTAVLPDDRRDQVRRAQHKYRQKKEATFLNAIARADQLEARIRAVREEAIEICVASEQKQLHISHPEIHARLQKLNEILMNDGPSIRTGTPSQTSDLARDQIPVATCDVKVPTPALASPISTIEHTYSFQEVRFARRLQRFCLEHAYRIFTDPRSDPTQVYRLFRLVSCVKDQEKTQPHFRQLLMGGIRDPLELFGLPFYNVGGAGTHFPDVDQNGNPIYPVNSRKPRRVLGISASPQLCPKARGDILEPYGLGGVWFDCRDVEGYLRLHGVDVNEGVFPELRIPNGSQDSDGVGCYALDIEKFFERLLPGLVILGRAPGFKRTDVKRALQASVNKVDPRVVPSGRYPIILSKPGA